MRAASFLLRHRRAALAAFLLLLAAGLPFAGRALQPDNSLRVWFVEGDPALGAYHAFHDRFGNDEVILVGYRPEGGALRPGALDRLDTLAARLERIDGVAGVYSAANAEDVRRTGPGWEVAPVRRHVLDEAFGDDGDVAAALRASPLVRGRFVSADGATALVWVQMAAAPDFDARRDRIVAAVRAEAERVLGPGQARLGGVGVIYAALNAATQRDFGVFMGACLALLFVLLGLAFGRVGPAAFALGVVLAAVALTLAAAGLAGAPLNAVTVVVPTLVTVLGLAGVVHLLNQHAAAARERPDASRAEVAEVAIGRTLRPALYAALTTAAGFLALVPAPIAALRQFGWLSAVGVGASVVGLFVLGAATLPRLDAARYRVLGRDRIEGALERLFAAVWDRPAPWAAAVAGLLVLGGWGALRVEADTYTLGYLPETDPAVQDHRFFEAHWGPYAPLDFTLRPADGRDLLDPDVLQATAAFADAAVREPEVRSAFGLHTLLRRYSAVRLADSTAVFARPDEVRYVVRQLEEEHSADLRRLLTADRRTGRLLFTGEMLSAQELGRALARLDALQAEHLEGLAVAEPAGYPPLYVEIVRRVTAAQAQSAAVALGLVFGLLALCLRSVRLALVAMPANVFPVLAVFGAMGGLGIPLDVATATVAALVLGVAVDDTVHLVAHVQRHAPALGVRGALVRSARGAGRAVVLTSALLALGFSVLLLASVQTVVAFGLLTALAAVAALVGDLVLLPLCLRLAYGRTVRSPQPALS